LSREALASENTEHPDYERNRRFLEDSELGITKDASIEWLARNYQWEDLLPQVFAALRDATARAGTQSSVRSLGGWIVNRLNNHLRSPKNYRATPLTAAEMRSPLYRRHMVMCVPEAEEISPAGASPVAAEDAQQPELPGLDGSQGSLICADGQTWSQVWARCRDELRLQMTGSTWEMWIRDTKAAQDGDLLAVVCKDAQVRDWLSQRLRQTILRTVAAAVGRQIELAFIIDEGGKQ
jgi:hypothetical protein